LSLLDAFSNLNSSTIAIQTVNPFTNEVVKTFDEMNDAQLEAAVAQADEAFRQW